MLDHVTLEKDGEQCRVFFFKGWGTYSHPIKPLHPISYEEALERSGFYRAWMCGSEENEKFVLFEGMELQKIELSSPELSGGKFYEALNKNGLVYPGERLHPSKTIEESEFITNAINDKTRQPLLVRQRVAQKFEYEYAESGALKRVKITNDDGDVNVLDY